MLKTAKVVGLNSDTDAALALVSYSSSMAKVAGSADGQPEGSAVQSEPPVRDDLQTVGFFVIISCRLEDAFSRIRQALAGTEEVFFQSTQPLSQRLSEVLSAIKQSLQDAQNMEVLVAATQEDPLGTVLYFFQEGASLKSYLYREGKSTELGVMAAGEKLVSGLLEEGDRVVLSTTSLFELLGEESGLLHSLPVGEIGEEIGGRLPQNRVYPVAAIVIEREKTGAVKSTGDAVHPASPRTDIPSAGSQAFGQIFAGGRQRFSALSKKRKRAVAVGIVVLLLGGWFLYSRGAGSRSNQPSQFDQYLKAAASQYQEAQNLKTSDPKSAQLALQNAMEDLNKALQINPADSRVKSLQEQMQGASAEITRSYPVSDFPLWLDLNLADKGFRAENLSLSMGSLLVLDPLKRDLLEVSLSTKSYNVLAGSEQLGQAQLAAINGEDRIWVYSDNKGIVNVNKGAKPAVEVTADSQWGQISDIYGFAGNIYLLDTGKNQVWKYIAIASGHSDKRTYFNQGVKVDLSGARRMQIDSSVWILKNDGTILRYTQGAPDAFTINGLDKPLKDPHSFYVADSTDSLYVLDSGNSRLVVFDKKGNYVAQYNSPQFGTFTDLVVDEGAKKVYLLDGSKIFQMDLR